MSMNTITAVNAVAAVAANRLAKEFVTQFIQMSAMAVPIVL